MKIKQILVITTAAVLLVGCTLRVGNEYGEEGKQNPAVDNGLVHMQDFDEEITRGSVNVRAKYTSNNQWDYSVLIELPTPCHTHTVDYAVQESFPETVAFNVTITGLEEGVFCTQNIQPIVEQGRFQASSSARLGLNVSNN